MQSEHYSLIMNTGKAHEKAHQVIYLPVRTCNFNLHVLKILESTSQDQITFPNSRSVFHWSTRYLHSGIFFTKPNSAFPVLNSLFSSRLVPCPVLPDLGTGQTRNPSVITLTVTSLSPCSVDSVP